MPMRKIFGEGVSEKAITERLNSFLIVARYNLNEMGDQFHHLDIADEALRLLRETMSRDMDYQGEGVNLEGVYYALGKFLRKRAKDLFKGKDVAHLSTFDILQDGRKVSIRPPDMLKPQLHMVNVREQQRIESMKRRQEKRDQMERVMSAVPGTKTAREAYYKTKEMGLDLSAFGITLTDEDFTGTDD